MAIPAIQWLTSDIENSSAPYPRIDVSSIPEEVLKDAKGTGSKINNSRGSNVAGTVEQLSLFLDGAFA